MKNIIIVFAIFILFLNGCEKSISNKNNMASLPVKNFLLNWEKGDKKEAYKIFIDKKNKKIDFNEFVKRTEQLLGKFDNFKINDVVNMNTSPNRYFTVLVSLYSDKKLTKNGRWDI